MMITTVTLNPCIDHTSTISKMLHGGLNIVKKSRRDIGGKGINVSMALKNLGLENRALTIGFSQSLQIQKEFFEGCGLESILVESEGKLRTNIKVFEESTGLMTELNEEGYNISEAVVKKLENKIVDCAKDSKIMVFGGSLCPGIPHDFYGTAIAKCKTANPDLKIILDSSRTTLTEGIKAKPYAIKPNLFELETAFNLKLNSMDDIISAARKIIAKGVEIVCVSMGKDGAVIVSSEQAFKAASPEIKPKSFQGAGDSMVCGMCRAILESKPLDDILRSGIAMASATILREGTLMGTKEDFFRILDEIEATVL